MYSPALLTFFLFCLPGNCVYTSSSSKTKTVPDYRPKFHYSVTKGWLSDPNGLLYYNGEYHMFYQHFPYMPSLLRAYWGHAVSKDLMHWEDLGVALSPDSLGWVTSGSGVVDTTNSAGFGINAVILIYSQVKDFALITTRKWVQSIAYSVDNGRTFTPYKGNPVIPNKGREVKEFRDPKVLRHPHVKDVWVGLMAANDVIRFYFSKDLKSWIYKSEFGGKGVGSHGGVWECPDLFPLKIGDKEYWVLLVSIDNSKKKLGGPNKGSATQYFIGQFDGDKFTSSQKDPLWLDYGPDNYASASFHGVQGRRVVVIGWMSNWIYVNNLPTRNNKWVGQMTLPRELSLTLVNGKPRLVSQPSREVETTIQDKLLDEVQGIQVPSGNQRSLKTDGNHLLKVMVTFTTRSHGYVCFSNDFKEQVCVGYHSAPNQIVISRETAANSIPSSMRTAFKRVATADRMMKDGKVTLEIYLDISSIEVFADKGLTSMTALYFTSAQLTKVHLSGVMTVTSAKVWKLRATPQIHRSTTKKKSSKGNTISNKVSGAGGSSVSGFLRNICADGVSSRKS